jgi:hypothetical protein
MTCKTFEGLFFSVFTKLFTPHFSEGYISVEDGEAAQIDVAGASRGESDLQGERRLSGCSHGIKGMSYDGKKTQYHSSILFFVTYIY